MSFGLGLDLGLGGRAQGAGQPSVPPIPSGWWDSLLSDAACTAAFIAGVRCRNAGGGYVTSGAVHTWEDLKGNGYHLVQATGANQLSLVADVFGSGLHAMRCAVGNEMETAVNVDAGAAPLFGTNEGSWLAVYRQSASQTAADEGGNYAATAKLWSVGTQAYYAIGKSADSGYKFFQTWVRCGSPDWGQYGDWRDFAGGALAVGETIVAAGRMKKSAAENGFECNKFGRLGDSATPGGDVLLNFPLGICKGGWAGDLHALFFFNASKNWTTLQAFETAAMAAVAA